MTAPRQGRWWARLPFVVVLGVGLWLWQGGGGLVAIPHTFVWKVPGSYGTVRRVDLQLWEGESLLVRAQLETPEGLTQDPQRELTLRPGRYRSEVWVWREGLPEPEVSRVWVGVDSAPTIVIR